MHTFMNKYLHTYIHTCILYIQQISKHAYIVHALGGLSPHAASAGCRAMSPALQPFTLCDGPVL